MATADALDTVWVGFMDGIPVIGTVKEGVEWILAVHENNKEVVMEKEKVIIGSLKSEMEKLEEGIKVLMQSETPEPIQEETPCWATAAEYVGLQNIEEIKKNEIMEHLSSCRRRIPKKSELRKIRRDIQDKLQRFKPDGRLEQELVNELGRSKKDQHVFNNEILTFYSMVLKQFKDHNGIRKGPRYKNVRLTDLDKHKLSANVIKEIVKLMTVGFEDTEFYVNANAVLYGRYSQALSDALQGVLECKHPGKLSSERWVEVKRLIDLMINHEIYVDHMAKAKWSDEVKSDMERFGCVKAEEHSGQVKAEEHFERINAEVVKMYCEEHGYEWCLNIMEQLRL